MRYTLQENAINSLVLAIDHFKKFYYDSTELNEKKLDESRKMCIIFLANAIELLIKSLLVTKNELSIYKNPDCKTIKIAQSEVTSTKRLEDILISKKKFQTIDYNVAINMYIEQFELYDKDKVKNVLLDLGNERNAIMHFGIDNNENYPYFITCIINTFDVIYNYMYPHLLSLDEIGHFFSEDDLVNYSIYGECVWLIDESGNYTNIIDFIDELLEEASIDIMRLNSLYKSNNIPIFLDYLCQIINDKSFLYQMNKINAKIDISDFIHFKNLLIDFAFGKQSFEINYDYSLSVNYSIYNNTTCFVDYLNNIWFLVNHEKSEILYYKNSCSYYLSCDEPEPILDIDSDVKSGKCSKLVLSKNNLRKVIIEYVQYLYNNFIEEEKLDGQTQNAHSK